MTPIVQSITQQHCHRHGLLPRAKRKAHRAKADRRHTTDAKLRWPAPQVLNPIKFWRLLLVVVAFTCFGLVRLNLAHLHHSEQKAVMWIRRMLFSRGNQHYLASDRTDADGSKGHCNVVYVAPSFANAVDPVIGTGVLTVLAAGIGTVLAGRNRTRAETEAERVQRRKTVQQEVEAIAAEYHAILPRAAAKFIGAAYARYSTKYQNSIADQVRAIYKQAVAYGVFIPVEFIFYDLGVRGLKDNRLGLNDLRAVMAAKKIEVALFFATNRLYRKMYRSLKFVEEELVERGIRAIFISQGIDTSDEKRWRTTLAYHAMFDEQAGANSADHIISTLLIGLVTQGLVSGSIPFGYQGDPIPGRLTRKRKPSRMLVVDPVVAHYVRLIFYWYVHEDLSIDEIARRLNNDPNCPPPPKASIHGWRHPSVIAVLRNTISRGLRAYGWTKRLWISSKDYARQIPRDKPLVEIYDERYRIVTDELFEAAKVKLDADRTTYSSFLRAENPNPLSVMNGLFICGKHGHRIYFNGTRGRYGLCPCCRAESENIRGLFTHLPRKRAVQKLCRSLAEMILNNVTLVDRVISICQQRVRDLTEA